MNTPMKGHAMEIISIINYKGGVGKTTLASNIAAELAHRGKNVLLLDADAQASLTFSFVTPDFWDKNLKENTIKDWFDHISEGSKPPNLDKFIHTPFKINSRIKSNGGKLDLIPSHLGLINVDLNLATLLGGANMEQSKKNYIKVHGSLRGAIRGLGPLNYDYIIIDCPPNFNIVTKNAIIASEKIIIPAKPDYLSTLGITHLKRNLDILIKEYNEYSAGDDNINPSVVGVIFTMIQITSGSPIQAQKQFIAQVRRQLIPTFDSYFRENKTIFASAAEDGIPVVNTRYGNITHDSVVKEIEGLVDEFVLKVK